MGVSHLQEVGAAQSGLTVVFFYVGSPSHVHLTLYVQLGSIMYLALIN